MILRRSLIAIALVTIALAAPAAFAADDIRPFTTADFAAAQKAGKPILVEIHADWCPTCKAQAPIISDLRKQARFKDLMVMRVDFDGQKDAVKRFGARTQSTLITFKGSLETGRSVGDTNSASIETLLAKAI
ncbi:Thioredoxin [Bosea sp. OK403]|uniref:thioredoxin family protein n=1 Tax=Bosea sp. OK403 TaxID=1855286 RepID=UPI0008F03CAA|nr:thioredoxin family protein [Bosea sp. OK403]SFI69335.1 Thioredoxin [Bosea sp. OK403]